MRPARSGDPEVWQYLPEKFTIVYGELVRLALSSPSGSLSGGPDRVSGSTEPKSPLKSAQALADKARIDRVLRKLAIEASTGQRGKLNQCTCGKFVQPDWAYCAWCGLVKGGIRHAPIDGMTTGTYWTGGKLQ